MLPPRVAELDLPEFHQYDLQAARGNPFVGQQIRSKLPEIFTSAGMWSPYMDGSATTVIDVPCGPGYFTAAMAIANPNATVYGVDISEDSIEAAREDNHGISNVNYQVGDVRDLSDFPQADLVTCIAGLHHFPDLTESLDQMLGRLLPGGILFLKDLNRAYVQDRSYDYLADRLEEIRSEDEQGQRRMLDELGWEKEHVMESIIRLMSFQASYTPDEVMSAIPQGYDRRLVPINGGDIFALVVKSHR